MKPAVGDKNFPGIQSFCASMGRWSCYAFCIVEIATRVTKKQIDPMSAILEAIEKGYIVYNWQNHNDQNNMFVQFPDRWMNDLTGGYWMVTKTVNKPDTEHVVECWNNAHFRLPDWDSLSYSNSVALGKITSWRVFKRIR